MPQSAIAPDIHQALDVHRDFTPQIALDPHLLVDDFANAVDFVVRQIPHARVRVDIGALEELLTGMEPNPEDIWQRRLNTLVARKIDSRNSRHVASPLGPRERGRLALPLLVPRIDANHPNHAVAPDDLALFAAASDRSSYFHDRYLSCSDVETLVRPRQSASAIREQHTRIAHAPGVRRTRYSNTGASRARQHSAPLGAYRDGVLEMRRQRTIGRDDSPAVRHVLVSSLPSVSIGSMASVSPD